ncbi:MAG: hypothetical protein QXM54_03395 [Desulfurococcaceae archaeon]
MKNFRVETYLSFLSNILDYIEKGFEQVYLEEVCNVKIVIKSYGIEKSYAKWFLIKTLNLPARLYPFVMNPYQRIQRELDFSEEHYKLGIVPKIVLVDWIGKKIVKEYVDGTIIDPRELTNIEMVAEALSIIHDNSYAIGDSKYSNFMRKNSKIVIVDAEQAIRTENPHYMFWDLIVFLSTIITRLIYGYSKFRGLDNIIESFLNCYFEKCSRALDVYQSSRNAKYRLATYALIPYPFNLKFLSTINRFIRK